jgi:Zn-dependent protease with chaperone function
VRAASIFSGGILLIVTVCGGCGGSAVGPVDRWAAAQGGVLDGAGAARVARAVQPLLDRAGRSTMSVEVLACSEPGAYAWPCGRIFVTRGLLEILDDNELAAAVAHELGHLAAEQRTPPPAGVDGGGREAALEAECAADAHAVALLRSEGRDPSAVRRMLAKLHADPRLPADRRPSLKTRIKRL